MYILCACIGTRSRNDRINNPWDSYVGRLGPQKRRGSAGVAVVELYAHYIYLSRVDRRDEERHSRILARVFREKRSPVQSLLSVYIRGRSKPSPASGLKRGW